MDYFVKILFLFSSSDAVQILQAEVTKLKERLEDRLRNKKPISSIRSAPSTQDNSSNQSTSSSCFRLFLFCFFFLFNAPHKTTESVYCDGLYSHLSLLPSRSTKNLICVCLLWVIFPNFSNYSRCLTTSGIYDFLSDVLHF